MRHLLYIVVACFLVGVSRLAAFAPPSTVDRVTWLKVNAVKIRTLNPSDEDFADLEALGASIGDARVVLLGEATHGDGAALLAKARLIKYLHQRHGFDVLAWEAGFYDIAKAGEALHAARPGSDAAANLLPAWSESAEARRIIEYVRDTQQTDRPIAIVGMGWYTYGNSQLFDDVVAFFEAVDPTLPTPDQRRALTRIKAFLTDLTDHRHPETKTTPPEMVHLEAMIERLERDPGGNFRAEHGSRATGFMRMALENLKAFVQFWYSPRSRGGADENPLGVIEGRNILFLAQEYFPGRRLIVSAHNGHLARGSAQIEELEKERSYKFNESILTGQRVHDVLGDAVYSIMFIAHGGKSNGWWGEPRELWPPPRDSLEDLMHRAGLEYAFVDLRGLPGDHWLRTRLVSRPISYAPMRANWDRVYDGVLFINSMTPTTATEGTP